MSMALYHYLFNNLFINYFYNGIILKPSICQPLEQCPTGKLINHVWPICYVGNFHVGSLLPSITDRFRVVVMVKSHNNVLWIAYEYHVPMSKLLNPSVL